MDESVRYISSEMETNILKSITFAIAMSFHSVLEGFALGVQENKTGIMTLFISLVIHKGIEAFSVGLQVSKSNAKRICVTTLTILVYAFMTPLGSMLGVMITVWVRFKNQIILVRLCLKIRWLHDEAFGKQNIKLLKLSENTVFIVIDGCNHLNMGYLHLETTRLIYNTVYAKASVDGIIRIFNIKDQNYHWRLLFVFRIWISMIL